MEEIRVSMAKRGMKRPRRRDITGQEGPFTTAAAAITNIVRIVAVLAILTLALTGRLPIVSQDPVPTVMGDAYELAVAPWDSQTAPEFVSRTGASDLSEEAASLKPGQERYLTDDLKRPIDAMACIDHKTYEKARATEREDLPNPVCWPKNAEVEIKFPHGGTYHGWLWNRSHLVAHSLGGDDIRDNLVAGTRCQNVGRNDGDGGMAWTESRAREWLSRNKSGTLTYEARPVYVGDEMVPRAVIVDMRSSDGALDVRTIVYNAAPGFAIDYADGSWHAEQTQATPAEALRALFHAMSAAA